MNEPEELTPATICDVIGAENVEHCRDWTAFEPLADTLEESRRQVQFLQSRILELEGSMDFARQLMKAESQQASLTNAANALKLMSGDTVEYQDRIIQWANASHSYVSRFLESQDDESIILFGKLYEVSYRACCEILEQRKLKVKITRQIDFEQARLKDKESRVKKETEKLASRRKTPEEYLIEQMMHNGMTRAAAEAQLKVIRGMK